MPSDPTVIKDLERLVDPATLGDPERPFSTGLKVYTRLDETDYPKGIEVSNAELAKVNIHRHGFHGDWNYTISPTTTTVIKS